MGSSSSSSVPLSLIVDVAANAPEEEFTPITALERELRALKSVLEGAAAQIETVLAISATHLEDMQQANKEAKDEAHNMKMEIKKLIREKNRMEEEELYDLLSAARAASLRGTTNLVVAHLELVHRDKKVERLVKEREPYVERYRNIVQILSDELEKAIKEKATYE